ncbi:MAG: SRPBCC family protein [Steroidobacter sp.]
MDKHIESSINVKAPVRTVYNQWTQFEEFPRFMEGVKEIRQLDDEHVHWVAEVGGKEKEWDAEITDQTPDRRIAWRSVSGALNAGVVEFRPIGADETEVRVRMEYEPEGAVETIGSFLKAADVRVKGDLKRFKEFIESRGSETGAWRGEIRGGARTDKGGTPRSGGTH